LPGIERNIGDFDFRNTDGGADESVVV